MKQEALLHYFMSKGSICAGFGDMEEMLQWTQRSLEGSYSKYILGELEQCYEGVPCSTCCFLDGWMVACVEVSKDEHLIHASFLKPLWVHICIHMEKNTHGELI